MINIRYDTITNKHNHPNTERRDSSEIGKRSILTPHPVRNRSVKTDFEMCEYVGTRK